MGGELVMERNSSCACRATFTPDLDGGGSGGQTFSGCALFPRPIAPLPRQRLEKPPGQIMPRFDDRRIIR